MNCEKCKNKKATLFYADEGGGRHALCAACGATKNKLTTLVTTEPESEEKTQSYLPAPTLTALLPTVERTIADPPKDPTAKCPVCATTAGHIAESGRMGCPRCYTVFADLFPAPVSEGGTATTSARMPSGLRKRMEKEAAITRLREELRAAVEGESFELAAVLRDKIKNLTTAT